LKLISQFARLKICTLALSPVARCCEHGNEHSGSIIWKYLLTIWVAKSFLQRSKVIFHITSTHTCSTQLKTYPLVCMTCWCGIIISETSSVSWGLAGRIWARTGCQFNISCQVQFATGDCGDRLECNGAGGEPQASVAEITLNGPGGLDYYNVSIVDGFNVGLQVSCS
jgi:hypothetical protein